MQTLNLHTNRSRILVNALRAIIWLGGITYVAKFAGAYFKGNELSWILIFQGVLGIAMIAAALFSTKTWNSKHITLNPEFIRTDEGTSYIRTAYWNKIDRLVLTRFNILITYQSGTTERFRLPFLNSTTFTELKEWLHSKTNQQNITFSIKPWWKLF